MEVGRAAVAHPHHSRLLLPSDPPLIPFHRLLLLAAAASPLHRFLVEQRP